MAQAIAQATIDIRDHHNGHEHGFFGKYIWAEDHKTIAIQYLFACLFFLCLGGLLAMGVRYQLAFPGHPVPLIGQFLPNWLVTDGAIKPGGYNGLVAMHATVMVFLVMMPLLVGVFGNYLISLKIGARDMAFPFFNALSFWLFFVSGIILLSSFFAPAGFPAAGWTSYVPLSGNAAYNATQAGQSLWCIGIFVNGLSSIAGSVNYITHRGCPWKDGHGDEIDGPIRFWNYGSLGPAAGRGIDYSRWTKCSHTPQWRRNPCPRSFPCGEVYNRESGNPLFYHGIPPMNGAASS